MIEATYLQFDDLCAWMTDTTCREGEMRMPIANTFLESVSLSPALADAPRASAVTLGFERVRLNTRFLDEGFSLLDSESLRVCPGWKRSRRCDCRVVGVVTDVRASAPFSPTLMA
jgi:hypothetical protein